MLTAPANWDRLWSRIEDEAVRMELKVRRRRRSCPSHLFPWGTCLKWQGYIFPSG